MQKLDAALTSEALDLDHQRVLQTLDGDESAFAELVFEYQRPLYNLTYRMLGDAHEAEDAAQEAFIRAYYHLAQYDDRRSFKTWLLSIGSHYCIDLLRKCRLRWLSLDETLPPQYITSGEDHTLDDAAINDEHRQEIQAMLNRLRPDDRAIIVLRYWNDLSYEEIAEALSVTVAVVKSRLFRARQSLANHLKLADVPSRLVAC